MWRTSQIKRWGTCKDLGISISFDRKGWNVCESGYYVAGLYRSSCNSLFCLEKIKCCQMGAYNGDSWVEKPDLVINIKSPYKQLKRCSMNAMDRSPSSDTYKCEAISDRTNMLELNALTFNIEDKSPLGVVKPQSVEGFRPVICSARSYPYKCGKSLSTAYENQA